jgi:hypothetical protein
VRGAARVDRVTSGAGAAKLVVLIPTRNRADLAAAAIESALASPAGRLRVLVSDNSTSDEQRAELAAACDRRRDPRLARMSPPAPLPMAEHWEWALARTLEAQDWTHLVVLTDRMIFRPGALDELVAVASARPGAVITYTMDRVDDVREPVVLEQMSWTGRKVDVPSTALLGAGARCVYPEALPRLLNTCVARGTIEDVRREFGTICTSISPDFCFAFRSLVVAESILYFDKPLLIQYAITRSNGHSHSRGVATADSRDFQKELRKSGATFATPLPAVRTVANAIAHEYCAVRAAAKRRTLEPMDVRSFFAMMTAELDAMEDAGTRDALRAVLSEAVARSPDAARPVERAQPKGLVRRAARMLSRAASGTETGLTARMLRPVAQRIRTRYAPRREECADLQAALGRARAHPRPRRSGRSMLELILPDARAVRAGS